MASNPDWYATNMDALMAWWVVFYDQLRNHGFAAKYGVDGTTLDRVAGIAAWFSYWVPLRHEEDAYSQSLTKYFNTIAGTDPNAPAPDKPVYSVDAPPDPDPVCGVEYFVRKLAKDIKNSMIYAVADGEAMGIATPGVAPRQVDEMQPTFKAVTREAFEVGVTFRKEGMSAVRFEYRHKGGVWLPAGVLLTSPGSFAVAPTTPGEPEQIELRAIFMQGNVNVGNWSTIVVVYVGP